MNITVDISQLKDLEKRLRNAGPKTVKISQIELRSAAQEVVQVARVLVPVDFGALKGAIATQEVNKNKHKIGANRDYAGYVEFGTGANVSVPAEWTAFALQFKSPVKEFAALRNGQHAQPFLYPAFKEGRRELIRGLEQVIKDFNLE